MVRRAAAVCVTFGCPAKLNPRQRRMIAERYARGETMTGLVSEFGAGEAKFGERFGLNRLPDKRRGFPVKIDLSHVLHWPPQPKPWLGSLLFGVRAVRSSEIVWPALVTGLIAIIGDDGTRPENEEVDS